MGLNRENARRQREIDKYKIKIDKLIIELNAH